VGLSPAFFPGISRNVVWNLLSLLYPRSGGANRIVAYFWSLGVANGALSNAISRYRTQVREYAAGKTHIAWGGVESSWEKAARLGWYRIGVLGRKGMTL
jgi:hypothetical protein